MQEKGKRRLWKRRIKGKVRRARKPLLNLAMTKDHSSENKSSFTPTTTANALDIEDVKRAAFDMSWGADLADDMAKRFKQL